MKRYLILAFTICTFALLQAQSPNLSVTSLQGSSVHSILQAHLAGDGVLISGCPHPDVFESYQVGKFNGQPGNVSTPQIGTFNRNGFVNFPFETGLVMTTGNVSVAAGPNNSTSASSQITSGAYTENALSSYTTNDVNNSASLEFDFIAMADEFQFNYIFGSEEYCEFVNTGYNDVFAFLLTGVDPVTLNTTTKNVAIVPGSVTASNPNGISVAINNVNHGNHGSPGSGPGTGPSNSNYFICNANNTNGVQYDGYTTALAAQAIIFSCQTYHMKLAVANVGDNNYDSGVFLEEGSFYSPHVQLEQAWETEEGGDTLIQNCRNLDLTFSMEHPSTTANTQIVINTSGSAVLNTDYSLIMPSGDTIDLENNAFSFAIGETTQVVHVKMLPTVQFTNPNQVKEARLIVVTQGCAGYGNLEPLFRKFDTIMLHFRANDSVRLRDTAFTACDTLKYIEVEKLRGSDSIFYVWLNNVGDTLPGVIHPDRLASECEITQSGIYKMVAHDRWNCMTDTAKVEVNIVPRPNINITYSPDRGCLPLPVTWHADYTPDYATLQWRIYDDDAYVHYDSTTNPHTTFTEEGYYSATLTVTSAPGCNDSLTLQNVVHVSGYPHADFSFSPAEPNNGEEVYFFNHSTGDNITNYSWYFGDGHSSYDEEPSHAFHLQSSDLVPVRLTVTNADGCSNDTTLIVPVEDNYAFFVPSGFTPNTDGKNEVFLPKVNGVTHYQLMIFNRNGELIFQTENPEEGWDGNIRGFGSNAKFKPAPEGVYIWKIQYARIGTPEQMMMKTGSLTLIR